MPGREYDTLHEHVKVMSTKKKKKKEKRGTE